MNSITVRQSRMDVYPLFLGFWRFFRYIPCFSHWCSSFEKNSFSWHARPKTLQKWILFIFSKRTQLCGHFAPLITTGTKQVLEWGVARDQILAFSFETISVPAFNFDVGDARPPNCTAIDQETSEGAPKNYGIFVRTDFWCQISRFCAGKVGIPSPWCKIVAILKTKNSILGNLIVFLRTFECIGTILYTQIWSISLPLEVECITAQNLIWKSLCWFVNFPSGNRKSKRLSSVIDWK